MTEIWFDSYSRLLVSDGHGRTYVARKFVVLNPGDEILLRTFKSFEQSGEENFSDGSWVGNIRWVLIPNGIKEDELKTMFDLRQEEERGEGYGVPTLTHTFGRLKDHNFNTRLEGGLLIAIGEGDPGERVDGEVEVYRVRPR